MFDPHRHQHRLKRARTLSQDLDASFLMARATEDLLERLSAVQREFKAGAALFGRSSHLVDAMEASPQIGSVLRVEEADGYLQREGEHIHPATPGDLKLEENSLDLVLAPLTLHWSNDLPGTLVQIRRALRPDGLLLASLPGPDTLNELRQSLLAAESAVHGGAAMRVDPFTDIRDAGALLQRTGFALPVVDQDDITVRYSTPLGLIRDLRGFAATAHLSNASAQPLDRAVVAAMMAHYGENFADEDGRIRASFAIVSMSGWKPHESQQKPLKPGSAKSRLADALNVTEKPLKG